MSVPYDQLPVHEIGLPHSWGLLDANLGTLSRISADDVVRAAATVQFGESIPLALSLAEINPPLFGRAQWVHSIHELDRNYFEDVLDRYNPQCSSQWDGFRHVRAREAGFYGGITDLSSVGDALGIEHLARRGIVGRGVLLDVLGWAQRNRIQYDPLGGQLIDDRMLAQVAEDQGVEMRSGDVLCVRTGYVWAYRNLPVKMRAADSVWKRFSGLRANEDMARFLWDSGIGALAADNPAIESAPGDPADGSLHRRLLPMLGVVMGELLDFDALAARCEAIGRHEFMFVGVPLHVPGGLSSPANALAVI